VRLAAVAALAALALPARADSFDPTDYDKIAHVSVSYSITLSVAVVARRFELPRWQAAVLGAATALVLGTAKELVHDAEFSWGDELANTLGAGGAVGLVFAFRL
jgi:VanZ family protein